MGRLIKTKIAQLINHSRNLLSSDGSLGPAISVIFSTLLGSTSMPSELTMVPKNSTEVLRIQTFQGKVHLL